MSRIYNCDKKCCTIEISEPSVQLVRQRRGHCRKAGVFIYDPNEQRVLLVQSRGQLWGPPKGTIEVDIDETTCQCAIREVKEETGLDVKAEDFSRALKIKNKATYYYLESKTEPITIQRTIDDNDANGITWIKIDCLQNCIDTGLIILNQHCKILLRTFLGKTFGSEDFVKV